MKKWISSHLLVLLVGLPVMSHAAAVVPKVFHTSNGIPVYFVQRNNLPMVDIGVIFSAGSVRDGKRLGIASMTQDLMGHGTQSYSEREISDILGDTGAILGSRFTRDMAAWTLRSLSNRTKLNKSVAVFHSILTEPVFPVKILKRIQAQTRVQILQQQQDPMSLAKNTFFQTMYAGHAYAHPTLGTKKSVARFKAKDCQEFYRKYYVAKNAAVILVGNLSFQHAKRLADRLTHGLKEGEKALPIEKTAPHKQANVFVPLRKSQTTLIMGQIGFSPYSEGYYARLVGNDIFGGSGLSSILSDEVREKRGLAYFAYSQTTRLQGNGPFVMLSQSRSHNARKTYRTILNAYHSFLQKGVSRSSLKTSKNSLIGRYQLANVSNAAVFSNLMPIVFYGFPANYFQTFPEKIKAVKKTDITASFSELKNKPLVAVMVGKKNAFPQKK